MHSKIKKGLPYIYLLPALSVIFFVLIIPFLNLMRFSFAKVSLIGKISKYVGLNNYKILLTNGFKHSFITTMIWVVLGIAGILIIGTSLALSLNKSIPGRSIFRILVMIPWVIPHVFAGTMWSWVFNSTSGIINNVLITLGLVDKPISFLGVDNALFTVIFIRIWKGVPFMVMSQLSALQSIPRQVEEAAMIDGATGGRYFFSITLPLIKPVVVMSSTILLAWSLTIFDLVFVITGGGPLSKTQLLSIFIYKQGFVNGNMGTASAVAVSTMIFVSIIAFFLMRQNIKEDLL